MNAFDGFYGITQLVFSTDGAPANFSFTFDEGVYYLHGKRMREGEWWRVRESIGERRVRRNGDEWV